MSNAALEWAYWVNQSAELWWRSFGHAALQCGAVAILGLVVVSLCKRWSSPLRYGILIVLLLKFAITPVLLLFVPNVTGELLTVEVPLGAASEIPVVLPQESVLPPSAALSPPAEPAVVAEPVLPAPSSLREDPAPWRLIGGKGWAWLAHLSGSVIVLLWLLLQGVRLGRWAVRQSHPAPPAVLALGREIQAQLRYFANVDVRVSEQAGSPMAFQLLRPVIVLPLRTVETLSPEELRPVLAHEMAHLKRRDPLVNTLQILLFGVWWFHPAYWWLHRKLRSVREECCDDAALSHAAQPEDRYCQILLDAARSCRTATAGQVVLGFGESRSSLGQRIVRIMDPRMHKRARLGWLAAIGLIAVFLLSMPMWRPSSSLDRPMPVTEASYGPTALESLTARLGLRDDLVLFMDSVEFAAINDCIDQGHLTRYTRNGVTDFELESTRDALLDLRGRLTNPFYAEFLLAKWYEIHEDPNEAAQWMARALAGAPVVLVRTYQLMDGRPLSNTPVGGLGIEYRVKTPAQSNVPLQLDYIDLTTDAKGRVYLPGYDTKIRCNSVQWPRGYEIETGRHGYLALRARYNLLPTIYVWPRGVRRPATTLPTSEFYDYRDASAAQGLTHRVGVAELSVDRCYRMGGDGRVTVTDGRMALDVTGETLPAFDSQVPALDQAVVHFYRSTLKSHEILQVRVFDHRSRTVLADYHVPADCEYDGDSSILLRSLGDELPERVDVWFWVTEFPPGGSKQVVPAQVGSRADPGQYSAELIALHSGLSGYSTTRGPNSAGTIRFSEPNDPHAGQVQVAFRIQGKGRASTDRYTRVAMVTKGGQRYFSDYVIRTQDTERVFDFRVPLSEVDHFELLPIGKERCFYFDGVLLPERPGGPLNPADALSFGVETNGQLGRFVLDTRGGVHVAVTVLAGRGGISSESGTSGMEGSNSWYSWEPAGPYTQTDTVSTIVCEIKGLSSRLLKTEILGLSGNDLVTGTDAGRIGNACFQTLAIPVSQIQSVRLRLSLEQQE